ncbi:MAG TPA: hypothetical protein VG844_19410 [Terracidiphilus sp.]|nr:hypothetical protein [Terracidiphilus sp.]
MQADWELEVGVDAPVIDTAWTGHVDLRTEPNRAHQLLEAIAFPALAEILILLNSAASPVRTSKCDIWPIENLEAIHIDRFDLEAGEEETSSLLGCYIDILPRNEDRWNQPAHVEQIAKSLCARLKKVPLRCCRVDIVGRETLLPLNSRGFGITAYWTASGCNVDAARRSLTAALHTFADAVISSGNHIKAKPG